MKKTNNHHFAVAVPIHRALLYCFIQEIYEACILSMGLYDMIATAGNPRTHVHCGFPNHNLDA